MERKVPVYSLVFDGRLHTLKCEAEYFDAIADGYKTFEVRFNDRPYEVYDKLNLLRTVNGECTGETLYRGVTYVLNSPEFCKDGYVILGITRSEVFRTCEEIDLY